MSLFTAMMTTLYGAFVEKQTVFYMLETLKIRPQTQSDRNYSALISLPAPLNVLLLVLGPFLATSFHSQRFNNIILWIAYLPVLIVTFTIYLVYTTALLPLCMVKMFFHKMVMIFMYSKSYRVHKSEKFMQWVMFLAIGPLRLTSNFLVDLVAFV